MAEDTVARILTEGDMEVHGRIAGSSNATLLVTCRLGDEELMAVYKPHKGERPLWDFPGGLYRREVAAYVLSESLGWGLVPETVERPEGPFGRGSVQRYVPEDGTSHYFTLRDDPQWHPTLIRLCAFDVAANNADRKSGHVLLAEGRLWAIDNGLLLQRGRQAAHRDLGFRRAGPGARRPGRPGALRQRRDRQPALLRAPDPFGAGGAGPAGVMVAPSPCAARIGRRRWVASLPVATGLSVTEEGPINGRVRPP